MTALPSLLSCSLRRPPPPCAGSLDLSVLVGRDGWERLPPAVQRRFGAAHMDTTYAGRMELRCSSIGRVYAWLSCLFGAPLTRINASDVPTTVRVFDNGRGGVVWERRFQSGRGSDPEGGHTVRSTKELGDHSRLLERTDGGLSMVLDVFEDQGSLVFLSRRFLLVLGALRIPVPAWLSPGVFRVTHTDLGQGLFRFSLSIRHPLWGETFHQTGVFADPVESAS